MTDRNPSSERKADATESMKTETATQGGREGETNESVGCPFPECSATFNTIPAAEEHVETRHAGESLGDVIVSAENNSKSDGGRDE